MTRYLLRATLGGLIAAAVTLFFAAVQALTVRFGHAGPAFHVTWALDAILCFGIVALFGIVIPVGNFWIDSPVRSGRRSR